MMHPVQPTAGVSESDSCGIVSAPPRFSKKNPKGPWGPLQSEILRSLNAYPLPRDLRADLLLADSHVGRRSGHCLIGGLGWGPLKTCEL